MPDSIYKIVELVGTSESSWEDAAKSAVEAAGKSLRDLRIAQIDQLDMKVENGKVVARFERHLYRRGEFSAMLAMDAKRLFKVIGHAAPRKREIE